MLGISLQVSLPGILYALTFEDISHVSYSSSPYFRVTYKKNRSLSQIASQIEEGVNVSQDRKVSVLVASWILVRGKAGGFGNRMYNSVVRVFRGLCTLPLYRDV